MGVHSKKQQNDGFSIIEVLLVLAIGGVILTIVFLAVPMVQRNARNTERRRIATYVLSQRLQYNIEQNTSASIPPAQYTCEEPITSKLFCQYIADGMGGYDMADITFRSNTSVQPTTVPVITDVDQIRTDSYLKCNITGTAAVVSDMRVDVTVLFGIETSDGFKQQCFQSGLAPKS